MYYYTIYLKYILVGNLKSLKFYMLMVRLYCKWGLKWQSQKRF